MSSQLLGNSLSADDPRFINRAPYIQITLLGMHNLEALDQGQLQPYLNFSYNDQSLNTRVLTEGDTYSDTFEFDTQQLQQLVVSLMDKDDYSKDSVITSVAISWYTYKAWTRKTDLFLQQVALDISEDEIAIPMPFTTDMELEGPDTSEAYVHLQILSVDEEALKKMSVVFKRHFIKSTVAETFTQYEIEVNRGDGSKWIVHTRYSAVYALKNMVSRIFPEFAAFAFPEKTYLECLSSLCPHFSRFNEDRIAKRQKSLEDFINLVLSKPKFECEQLMDLLQVPNQQRLNQDRSIN